MALAAKGVALHVQLGTVRVVAIAAGDSGGVHSALQEGAVDVDFILDLAIRVVEALVQQRGPESVQQRIARMVVVAELAAARVALGTGFKLRAIAQRRNALGDGSAIDKLPLPVAPARPIGTSRGARACCEPGPWQASQSTLMLE